MNVVSLKNCVNPVTRQIRLIGRGLAYAAQPLKRSRLVAKRLQECVREFCRIKRLLDQLTDCFFDLDRVQPLAPSIG
jgi:hypothetical protein